MPTIAYRGTFKRFLDETADNLGNLKAKELEELYENLVETVLEQDSSDIIEEIFAFCSASVLEMIQSAKGSLLKILQERNRFKSHTNFHVLTSSVVSTIVKSSYSDFDVSWIDLLLEAVISGLTAIESDTISLSGSSLIKLLQWPSENGSCCERISKQLANHSDFVAILTADMCAMFSRIDEIDSVPFLRIVRFCELLIDVSDKNSGLVDKIVNTVQTEFITKIYRTTLKTMTIKYSALKWSNELLKVCHRGNELVKPLVGEVFTELKFTENFLSNSDFIGILESERSRTIPEIVELLFSDVSEEELYDNFDKSGVEITEEYYKNALVNQLESFERFKVDNFQAFKGITPFSVSLFQSQQCVLFNWLPYVLKVAKIKNCKNAELKVHMDISKKLIEFLDL